MSVTYITKTLSSNKSSHFYCERTANEHQKEFSVEGRGGNNSSIAFLHGVIACLLRQYGLCSPFRNVLLRKIWHTVYSIQFNSIQFIQLISFNKIYKLIQPAYSKANRGGLYKLDISNKDEKSLNFRQGNMRRENRKRLA